MNSESLYQEWVISTEKKSGLKCSFQSLHLKYSLYLLVDTESGSEGHSWDGPSTWAIDSLVPMHQRWAHDRFMKRPKLGTTSPAEALIGSTNTTHESDFCWTRHSFTRKMNHGAAWWTTVSVYLEVEGFPGHRNFSAETGKILLSLLELWQTSYGAGLW